MNPNHKPWTQRDLDTLRREYPRRTAAEVAQMLGRSEKAITKRANNLGLKKAHHGLNWTPQMLTLLRALYPITFGRALAATLGVSFRSLTLTPEKPLFGHKSGKAMGTHWVCFMKSVEP